ncbi:hypothetical protein PQX77_011194 [Marasmius sp. AFHP31]|nr:hypothetical protein PQX77_011194 [Marasmius sp. AFHP31]
MDPNVDLDYFGRLAFGGSTELIKKDIEARLENYSTLARDAQLEQVAREIFRLRYGPNRTPIMNCIGQARLLLPDRRPAHLEVARYILETFAPVTSKVNIVDTPDLAGTTALAHAISTKPSFDPEFAQLLWDHGANINKRNRYGATAAHEFSMVWKPDDRAIIAQARNALEWFLAHGGDPDIADGDGMKSSLMISKVKRGMDTILREHQSKRKRREEEPKGVCLACGDKKEVMRCSKCRSARYCSPPRKCQLADWPRHKQSCGNSPAEQSAPSTSGEQSSPPPQQQQGFNYLGVQMS